MQAVGAFFATIITLVTGWFGAPVVLHPSQKVLDPAQVFTHAGPNGVPVPLQPQDAMPLPSDGAASSETHVAASVMGGKAYSHTELLAMAGDAFADGNLPLGDSKYVTNAPKKGYIYLCRTMKEGGGGAGADGPWIKGTTWNINEKLSILGSVSWPNASFSTNITGASRTLKGNGLPKTHMTGVFPVASSDPAYAYDRNPNSIKAQSLSYSLPANPTYSETPACMGGEAGIMLTGVPLFNGFDAEMRDAAAHEVQDRCEGHPQVSGQYHYHSMSSCFQDTDVTTVLGYALDGFPITGPVVEKGKYLTTDDLDVCHGLTNEIVMDGKKTIAYHYVMTMDFPYSVSCFRGKPSTTGPSGGGQGMQTQMPQMSAGSGGPPAEAKSACTGKADAASCVIRDAEWHDERHLPHNARRRIRLRTTLKFRCGSQCGTAAPSDIAGWTGATITLIETFFKKI